MSEPVILPARAAYAEGGAAADSKSDDVATHTLEFFGASDDTIGEAVRRALARASETLHTLDGVTVLVIPQILPDGAPPRFRVYLRVTPPFDRLPSTSGPTQGCGTTAS